MLPLKQYKYLDRLKEFYPHLTNIHMGGCIVSEIPVSGQIAHTHIDPTQPILYDICIPSWGTKIIFPLIKNGKPTELIGHEYAHLLAAKFDGVVFSEPPTGLTFTERWKYKEKINEEGHGIPWQIRMAELGFFSDTGTIMSEEAQKLITWWPKNPRIVKPYIPVFLKPNYAEHKFNLMDTWTATNTPEFIQIDDTL